MHFQIELANKIIDLQTVYRSVFNLCRNYLCEDKEPDLVIETTESDIYREREISDSIHRSDEGIVDYSDRYLESLAVYRKIADQMLTYDTFLMHGSVVACPDNTAIMITARSGVGKTTRTRMWLEQIPGSYIVNGDKPLVQVRDQGVLACGTPWSGKERMDTNCIVPLKAIFFLERSEVNSVKEISILEAFPNLLQQVYRPDDMEKMKKTLTLLKGLSGKVRFFRFCSNLEEEAIRMAYQKVYETEGE